MKHPRISIAKAMALVGVVALDLAYLRWYGVEGTLVGTRLIVLLLQAGLLYAILRRSASRRFWGGFVTFGTFALLGWFGAFRFFPEVSDEYFRQAMNAVLRRFPLAGYNQISMPEPSHIALAEVLLTIPQLVAALAGGALAVVLFRSPALARRRVAGVEPHSGTDASRGMYRTAILTAAEYDPTEEVHG